MISYKNEGIGRLHEYIIPLEKIMKLNPLMMFTLLIFYLIVSKLITHKTLYKRKDSDSIQGDNTEVLGINILYP